MPVDEDVSDDLEPLLTACLRTDDRHRITMAGERRGLVPHPRIEWNGEILDDDQDAAPMLRCRHARGSASTKTARSVRKRIFRSSHRDQLRTYSMSRSCMRR